MLPADGHERPIPLSRVVRALAGSRGDRDGRDRRQTRGRRLTLGGVDCRRLSRMLTFDVSGQCLSHYRLLRRTAGSEMLRADGGVGQRPALSSHCPVYRPSTTHNDTVDKFVGEPKSPPGGDVSGTAALGHGRSSPERGKRPRPGGRAEVLSLLGAAQTPLIPRLAPSHTFTRASWPCCEGLPRRPGHPWLPTVEPVHPER